MAAFVCVVGPHLVTDKIDRYEERIEIRRQDHKRSLVSVTMNLWCLEHARYRAREVERSARRFPKPGHQDYDVPLPL